MARVDRTSAADDTGRGPSEEADGRRGLSLWGFAGLVVVYLAIIQGVGLALAGTAELTDGAFTTVEEVAVHLWIPLGLALVLVYGAIAALGWWRPVFRDERPVQRWVLVVPVILLVASALAADYGQLADNGLGFTLALLLATQLVGWGEEGMFRGIGVVALRDHGLSEARVALWSSVVFGAVHLTNAIGRGAGAIPQAVAVSFAGYFFYLIRRVSRSNVLNSVTHGLFDFALLSATAIAVDADPGPGVAAPILAYPLVAIVLLVRRRRIEPEGPDGAPEGSGTGVDGR
jgi:uncharacterized protein